MTARYVYFFLLVFSVGLLAGAWLWLPNYYTDYDPFYSKLYAMNLGSAQQPVSINNYSPQAFIAYETLWRFLYGLSNRVFWYDYTMLAVVLVAGLNYWAGFKRLFGAPGWSGVWVYVAVGLLVFYWPVRLQNLTLTGYLVCLCALFNRFTPAGGRQQHRASTVLWVVGLLAGALIRWEVGVMAFFIYATWQLTQTGVNRWVQLLAPLCLVVAVALYANAVFALEKDFYRQIEPDGEYVVLYQKAVQPPAQAGAFDSLRYHLLNVWMLDDTNFITLPFFKQAIVAAKATQQWPTPAQRYKLWIRLKAVAAQTRFLPLFCLLVLVFARRVYRPAGLVCFAAIMGAYMGLLVYNGLFTERHFYPLWWALVLALLPAVKLLPAAGRVGLTGAAALVLVITVNSLVAGQLQRQQQYVAVESTVQAMASGGLVAADAQYMDLVPARTLTPYSLLLRTTFVSLQQHSYLPVFARHITNLCGHGPYHYGHLYECLARQQQGAFLIISDRRMQVLKQVLVHYNSPVQFTELAVLSSTMQTHPFANLRLYRVGLAQVQL